MSRSGCSSGNVFVDLGFEPAEAAVMQMRAMLQIHIESEIEARGWTILQACEPLGLRQTHVARIMWQGSCGKDHEGRVAEVQPGSPGCDRGTSKSEPAAQDWKVSREQPMA